MTSRNIAVKKSVYDALQREKRSKESFTSVLQRLLGRSGGIEELVGAWGSKDRSMSFRQLRRSRRRR